MNQTQNSAGSQQKHSTAKTQLEGTKYPTSPTSEPGLVGGPATSAVPQPDPDVIDEVVNEAVKEKKQAESEIKDLTE